MTPLFSEKFAIGQCLKLSTIHQFQDIVSHLIVETLKHLALSYPLVPLCSEVVGTLKYCSCMLITLGRVVQKIGSGWCVMVVLVKVSPGSLGASGHEGMSEHISSRC